MAEPKRGKGELFTDPNVEKAREFFSKKKATAKNKLVSVSDAIRTFVKDGAYITTGGFSTNRIPTALLHEIVRQGRKDLGLSAHAMTHAFQILCAGECVSRCDVAYIIGLEIRGRSRNARRLVESGKMKLCEWTNAATAWRMRAAAMGVSFIPARVMLGTDTFEYSAAAEVECPFTGQKYAALPALYPDVALIHVHRADPSGNAEIEGATVADLELSQASKHVIISTEEVVPEEVMRRRPDRITIPALLVDAVVEVPFGSYPGNMIYRYFSDERHLKEWLDAEEDPDTFKAFLDKYIYGTKDFYEYLELCGGIRRMCELRREEFMLETGDLRQEGSET